MTNQDIVNAVQATVEEMRYSPLVPYDTGNLAKNALSVDITQHEIVVFLDQSVAPYAPYTNEPWIAPYWKGKSNPNEGWWERFCEEFAQRLAQKLRGEIKT